jgi:nitrogen fixation protein FixH
MGRILLAALTAVGGLWMVGCGERPQSPNWQVALELVPASPRPMEEVTFVVRIKTRADEALTGAEVEVELSMPSHRMGENRFRARETEAGVYRGTGKFTMPGEWQVEARVEKGGQRQVEEFRFDIK